MAINTASFSCCSNSVAVLLIECNTGTSQKSSSGDSNTTELKNIKNCIRQYTSESKHTLLDAIIVGCICCIVSLNRSINP